MEEMTDMEISSILESDLTSEEKSSILDSYDRSNDNKLTTPFPIKLEEKIEDTKANTKKDNDDYGKSKRNTVTEANADPNPNANPKETQVVDPLTAEEISSIFNSKLTSEEKSSLLMESSPFKMETKTHSTPSAVKFKGTVQQVETKREEDNHDKLRISKGTDESFSQAKVEEPLDLKSTSDKKQSSISSGAKLKEKIKDTKPNTKKVKDDGRKSESESNTVEESNPNANAEKKELADPLTDEEISSILDSELTSEEKSSLLRESNLIKKETKMRSTPSTVKFKEEVQHVGTKPKEDNHVELRTHGISKGTDESLSQAKEKVPLDLKSTSDEKSSSIACNRNKGEDIPSSKVNTSSISSSEGKLKGKNQHMETAHDPIPRHENRSPKLISKGSPLRAQVAPPEDHLCLQELKEHILVTAREIREHQTDEPQTNPEGGAVDTIYKKEAICKGCWEPMFDENNVLKAKCKCKLALIHATCAKTWEEEKGTKCLACEEQIKYISVTLAIATSPTSSPQKTNNENLESPTYAPKSYWCCF
ncbi:hypothetical protein CDL12_04105 [Handroanthus impetiginosus]|uniref:RING-CH-type domain-containing protein n=1 Tax=Handroanthus impetiginosus TaxID=429701 RepID=A0A2G9I0A1_9LAMI|nr:hypothetical protein CDL12_04105 [Handroanthus impetiginosus]